MPLSGRRPFQHFGGSAHHDWISARGREAAVAERSPFDFSQPSRDPYRETPLRLSSNENPVGPGQHVLDVIISKFPEAGRYPFNAREQEPALVKTIASKHGIAADHIVLGCGSTEILCNAVRAFTSPTRPLATPWPTFETCRESARRLRIPVREVPLDAHLRIDIDKTVEAAKGAGLVVFCNPNNPTATAHGHTAVAEFVRRTRAASPDTVILVDEAYFDYFSDPNYKTAIDIAKSTPRVFVTRTFSKAHGMAGMRIGYGVGDCEIIKALDAYRMPLSLSVPAIAAAVASLNDQVHIDQERARNTAARAITMKAFEQMGFKPTESQANFIFVKINRPAAGFRDACRKQGVIVGRDFAPYQKTHVRISLGTQVEMYRAIAVFRNVLGSTTRTSEVRPWQNPK